VKLPLITAIGVAAATIGVGIYYFTAQPSHPPIVYENQDNILKNTDADLASIFSGFKNFFGKLFGFQKDYRSSSPKPAVPPAQAPAIDNAPFSPRDAAKPSKDSVQKIPEEAKAKPAPSSKASARLSGSYRCWSYNVSGGGGGNCRLFQPIVLKADGTYSVSSEKGTYSISGDKITLSESKLRGIGTLLEGNMQIRFEYDYNGWHHIVTYLREGESGDPPETTSSGQTFVEVTLRIIYPAGDSSADSVNTVTLYPKEGGPQAAQSLAYATDRQTTEVWFSKRSPKVGVQTGKVYKVMVGSGFDEWQVGELDLRGVKNNVERTIKAPSSSLNDSSPKTETSGETDYIFEQKINVSVELTLKYPPGDDSLHNVTRIHVIPQGEEFGPNSVAGYGQNSGELTASFSSVEAGIVHDVYVSSYTAGQKKVGILDLRGVSARVVKTISVQP